MSEESKSTENKNTKNPMSVFVKLTVVSLVFTASVMFLFYNFAKFKNVDVGSLGGAFQGTFGVAAAVAGAIVTIQLAKIAIDQAIQSNDIAARQARNDDPAYLEALKIRDNCNDLNGCIHSILLYTRQATDAASRYTNAEISFKNDFKEGKNKLDELAFQNELNKLRHMKKNVFQCFIRPWADEFSRLLISINPYMLKTIEYRLKNDVHKIQSTDWSEEPGVKWVLSTYTLQKNIMDLSENTGNYIQMQTLVEILNHSEYLIEMLNVDETTNIKSIQTILAKNDMLSIPSSIKNMLNNFKEALEKEAKEALEKEALEK